MWGKERGNQKCKNNATNSTNTNVGVGIDTSTNTNVKINMDTGIHHM